jgi:hypothetical protein
MWEKELNIKYGKYEGKHNIKIILLKVLKK